MRNVVVLLLSILVTAGAGYAPCAAAGCAPHPGDPDGADYPEAIGTNMPLTPLSLLAASDPLDHVLRHDLFHLGPIAVSNQMVMAVVAALLMLLMFPMLFNRAHSGPPSGARNFFES